MKREKRIIEILCFLPPLFCGTALAANSESLERVANYSLDQGVAYPDDQNSALFHIYTDDQPDIRKSRAEAPHVYQRVDVLFKDGELRPGKPSPLTAQDITTQFSDVDDFVGDAEERLANSSGVYSLSKGIKIDGDTTIDVAVQPSGETRIMSRLIVHHKGHTEGFDYYSVIRRVFPIPIAKGKTYIGVIADNCGNSGCESTIEVLRFK